MNLDRVTSGADVPDEVASALAYSVLGRPPDGLWIGTFHSICARLLRREAPLLGFTRTITIYDEAFTRLDDGNIGNILDLLRQLGLQMLDAAPTSKRFAFASRSSTDRRAERDMAIMPVCRSDWSVTTGGRATWAWLSLRNRSILTTSE